MTTIIDQIEAAAVSSEMSGVLHQRDTHERRHVAHLLGVRTEASGMGASDDDALAILARPLSLIARHAAVALLVPRWDAGKMLHVLSILRATDRLAWLDTVTTLGWSWRLPVIELPRWDTEHVLAVQSAEYFPQVRSPRRHPRCRRCGDVWIEVVRRHRIHRICTICGRITRTRVTRLSPQPKPNPRPRPRPWHQVPLFTLPPR